MFCWHCGKELPDDANYCLKCGQPQQPDIYVAAPKWERCQILRENIHNPGFGYNQCIFRAIREGSSSKLVGESEVFSIVPTGDLHAFPDIDDEEVALAHQSLITKLVEDGWKIKYMPPADRGDWWNVEFERRIR